MSYTVLIIFFLIFSFIGWVLDSIFSTIELRKVTNSGYFRELPLCPMYGLGGIVLFLFTAWMQPYPWYVTVLVTGVMLSLVEYLGGLFCVFVLKERLWDYSNKKWHLSGHIEAFHSFCWFLLSAVFYFYVFPQFLLYAQDLDAILRIPPEIDTLILMLFLLFSFVLTFTRRRTRLRKKYGSIPSPSRKRHRKRR